MDLEPPAGLTRLESKLKRLGEEIQEIKSAGELACIEDDRMLLFKGMYRTLESTYDKYVQLYDECIDYATTYSDMGLEFPQKCHEDNLKQVRLSYYQAHGLAEKYEQKPVSLKTHDYTGNKPNANLPKINIAVFNGSDICDWPRFKGLFTSLILNKQNLENDEKMHYLLSFLRGSALDAVKHLTVSGENFEAAWKILMKNYDDKRQLASLYIDKLLRYKSHGGKPNIESLNQYLTQVSESVTGLKNLGVPNLEEYLLFELSLRGLDSTTRHAFETKYVDTPFPTFSTLKDFVQNEYKVLSLTPRESKSETYDKPNKTKIKSPNTYMSNKGHALLTNKSDNKNNFDKNSGLGRSCFVCPGRHTLSDCPRFKDSSAAQRLDMLKQFPGCRNCLHPQHKTRDCQSKFSCRECNLKHHTLLHLPYRDKSMSDKTSGASEDTQGVCAATFLHSDSEPRLSEVLLGTVNINIKNKDGKFQCVRGVLDPGSQYSFMTENCKQLLKLPTSEFQGSIAGVNASPLSRISGKTVVTLRTSDPPYQTLETTAIIVPTITGRLPRKRIYSANWRDYFSYRLSDPNFNKPGPIDFLIGADLYPDVVTGAPVIVHSDGPRVMDTIFGFVVIGRLFQEPSNNGVSLFTYNVQPLSQRSDQGLHSLIENFWLAEEPTSKHLQSSDDERCEDHFKRTHFRTETGRYVVTLPFRDDPNVIVPSQTRVMSRLYSVERKLMKHPNLQAEYTKFMQEYVDLGHMSHATESASFIIPHHPVVKMDGETISKIRVVFDASFKSFSGSLNDHLLTGPKLQKDITEIMLNFRRYTIVFTCDIVKMFRQILVRPEDRKFLQIVWRFNPDDPILYWELNTVTYGVCCAPYQANRCIKQLGIDEGEAYPEAAKALEEDIYIDDFALGRDTVLEAINLKQQLVALLSKGGFELAKWASNCPSLLDSTDCVDNLVELCPSDSNDTVKILGMRWHPTKDTFSYVIQSPQIGYTKRLMLSTIARLFDPLGYLAPVVFLAKCLMQELWRVGTDWDEEAPSNIKKIWDKFIGELSSLSEISIPRLISKSLNDSYQLLCFCDASEKGMCAVIYIRSLAPDNSYVMTLIKAKTKLAPVKAWTIPRLELGAALLGSQVYSSLGKLKLFYKISDANIYFFSDSTTVLSWLKKPPKDVFVQNRVSQIVAQTPSDRWFYVRSAKNPADIGSRGVLPSALKDLSLWWHGPSWSSRPVEEWPLTASCDLEPDASFDTPISDMILTLAAIADESSDFIKWTERHSSYRTMIHVLAYIKRFVKNIRAKPQLRKFGPVDAAEFMEAEYLCFNVFQRHHFPDLFKKPDVNLLKPDIRRLDPFISDNIIRVGGRLAKSPLSYDQKHQILLPSRSHLTNVIIDFYHRKNHHVGPNALLAIIRQRFWFIGAKNLVKLRKRLCPICIRFAKVKQTPYMGQLPPSRFSSVRPFLTIGVDFAGPFLCKESHRRKASSTKAYLCLIVCLSTKALHLELATSLSTEEFLNCFDRFTARRGVPQRVISDNGSNFVGAARYLNELFEWWNSANTQRSIIAHTSCQHIHWSFNPPYSPHFGGIWEAGVRSVKNLLYKSFGNQPYTEHELSTMFTKVEGVLNSRPLQDVSSDPMDLQPLTPGHFIIGQPLTALPEEDFSELPPNRLSRWQLLRERVQHFWDRWRKDYLSTLQSRSKWDRKTTNLSIGDLVIIEEKNIPPMHWPMGRVIDTHPGEDNTVRVVSLRTTKGVTRRSTTGLILLLKADDIVSA